MGKRRKLLFCLALPLLVGGASALLTFGQMDVYKRLTLPALAPPGWIFPIIWTILYLLMGYGLYLALQEPGRGNKLPAILLFTAQLILNFFWPLVFFNLRQWFAALLLLLALLMVAVAMTIAFWQIRRLAGFLQIPYCLWLSFAAYLNWSIFLRN